MTVLSRLSLLGRVQSHDIFSLTRTFKQNYVLHLTYKPKPTSHQNYIRIHSVVSRVFNNCRKHKFTNVGKNLASIGPAFLPALLSATALYYRQGLASKAKCKTQDRRIGLDMDENVQDPPFNWSLFFEFLRPQFWLIVGAVVAAIVVAGLNVLIPRILGEFIDVLSTMGILGGRPGGAVAVSKGAGDSGSSKFLSSNFLEKIKGPSIVLIGTYVAQGFFTFCYITFLSFAGENIASDMRKRLFASLLVQDIAFFDEHKTGELLSRLTTDVQDFKSSFKSCISQGFRSLAQALGCVVSLYMISPQLTCLLGTVIPILVLTGSYIGSGLRRLSKKAQHQVAKSSAVADEAIGNIRTVRAFAMEDREKDLFNEETDKATKLNKQLGYSIGAFQGLSNIALNGIVLGVLCAGGSLMADSHLRPGDLMAFLVAAQTIQRSLSQLSLLFGQAIRGMGAGSRVFEYIEKQPTIPLSGRPDGYKMGLDDFSGDISFEDVCFSYPTRPEQTILKNFSFNAPAGKMVALVGESGGGKSTVTALLERFYDVDGGSIKIDGVDIRCYDPSWLRGEAVGLINQEPILFATSVLENIRYGRPAALDHEVKEAAKMANAHNFIKNFPAGYDTVLGERGVTVSGGQKQRIAIARALLKNPKILILDEATSALDAESERIVQEALDKAVKGRTVLVVAHRLSTIKSADVIAVIDKGVIKEMGDYESLMAKGGRFARLMQKQTDVDEENGSDKEKGGG